MKIINLTIYSIKTFFFVSIKLFTNFYKFYL